MVLALGVAACSDPFEVECDGVLADGELCDDGDSDEYDGCDCAARLGDDPWDQLELVIAASVTATR